MQSPLVGDRAGEGGDAGWQALDLEPLEPVGPARLEMTLDPDLVQITARSWRSGGAEGALIAPPTSVQRSASSLARAIAWVRLLTPSFP